MTIERVINGVVYEFADGTPAAVIRKFEASKTASTPGATPAAPTPAAPPAARPEPMFTGAGGAALQGLTMGFSDEAIARARSLGGDRSYEDYLKAEREAQRKYAEEHPVMSTAAELAGGTLPAVLTGGLSAIPSVGAAAARTFGPRAAGLLFGQAPSIGRMATAGAGSGAVTAVGTSEKQGTELGAEALRGTVAGGATAGTIGVLGKYILAPAFGKIKMALGFGDANKASDVAIARALERDGMTPDQALAKLQAFSRGEMTLADLGENTTALLRRSSAAPGPARIEAKGELATREAGRIPRVSDDMRSLMSGSKDFYTDVQDLMKKRATDADSLYRAAWDSGAEFSAKTAPEIEKLRNLPTFKEAMKKGATRMADQELDIADPKNTLRALHETKIALDDMIGEAVRAGKGGQAGVLIGMKERMLKDMERAAPEYRTAREAYAGDSEMLAAMNEGRRIYELPELEMRKLIDRFKDSPSEYDAFRSGIAQVMLEKLRVAGPTADPTKTLLSRDAEAKIRRAFRDDTAFDEFKNRLGQESTMLNTEKAGFRKTPVDTDLDQSAGGVGAAANLFAGRPVAAAQDALRANFPNLTGTPPRVAAPTVAKLLAPTSDSQAVIGSIMQSLKADEARLLQAAQATTGGAALMGGLAATRSTKQQYPESEDTPPGVPAAPPLGALAQ
jgi:hypothetical protein